VHLKVLTAGTIKLIKTHGFTLKSGATAYQIVKALRIEFVCGLFFQSYGQFLALADWSTRIFGLGGEDRIQRDARFFWISEVMICGEFGLGRVLRA